VLEVAARSAANILGIHPNSAALFYRKIRQVISFYLAQDAYALDVNEFHHYRIYHSDVFVDEKNHIDGIENFWNQAKRVLRKYNGIDKKYFYLFLRECEIRFNNGTPRNQLKILRK